MKRAIFLILTVSATFLLVACEEGPFGNTPPQGRPEWMKDKKAN